MHNVPKKTATTSEQLAELEKRLTSAAKEGRIQCASAQAIAKSLNLSKGVVRNAADELKLKISKCQLGCF
jgi:LAO/AO transport system kinase